MPGQQRHSLPSTNGLPQLSHRAYLAYDHASLSPWLAMEGFQIESMSYDWMHNIYLGCGRDLVASGIKTLIMQKCYDSTGLLDYDDILVYVNARIRKVCKRHGPPVFALANFFETAVWGFLPKFQLITSNLQLYTLVLLSHSNETTRLSVPGKPQINNAGLGGPDDYAELSTRFKASHVKTLIFWLCLETTKFANANPDDAFH